MEEHASELAKRAAAAAGKRNAGTDLAGVLTEVCGLLVSLSARISSLEGEAGFRDYTAYVPADEKAAPGDSHDGESGQPGAGGDGQPDDAGAECSGSALAPAPAAPVLVQKKDPSPPAGAPPPDVEGIQPAITLIAEEPPADPSDVILELSERFVSMTRKQAAHYSAKLKEQAQAPAL